MGQVRDCPSLMGQVGLPQPDGPSEGLPQSDGPSEGLPQSEGLNGGVIIIIINNSYQALFFNQS